MHRQSIAAILLAAGRSLAAPTLQAAVPPAEVKCPIVFDGRVPVGTAPSFFDSYATNTIYNPDYVKGNDLKWSEILKFPNGTASRFDGDKYTSLEVTVSDKSIFQKQNGFRRAGLQFLKDAADGPGTVGVKTLHFSVKQDAARPLNLTHEFLNVWHEAADYSSNQIQFQTGQLIGKSAADKEKFKILDRNGNSLYSVAIDKTEWQNFAITLNYDKNQVQIYYSVGQAALKSVAGPSNVDLKGAGQFQLGILRKPTGSSDVVNSGYHQKNLNEGQIYGGVFLEDSANSCVTL
ncbi:glycoside hydrolase family 131 protein [Aaosphaeria arxii CBS 175.79]|uniref:Glycoside hydrolase family 131 protein n=1 Tax=Aaosphaeria arxii CBS 175.79 TaxID=1450172 RepID=A0A6A5XNJ9_9PLEO|nr:glycoside hydrolase family 131 protein [Aaosphaeria arxii CBS 175.79]KAF2014835.1 glycoside hydrolase family 131 protein [Aaosphaeria arxii CBS 175.79]